MSANADKSSSWRTSTLHCRPCIPKDPATWSQYPATQDVDIGCYRITDVSGINFCDGSYVGHGDSFDISSGEKIVVATTNLSGISLNCPGTEVIVGPSGEVTIVGGSTLRLEALSGDGGVLIYDDSVKSLTLAANGATITEDASGAISLTTAAACNITMSSPPIVVDTTIATANQLISRSYLDNLINIALPAIAGYAPGTCCNLNKNIGKSTGNLTSVAGNGNLYFLYPFIDTPISKVVTYTGSASLITTATTVGLSLIEYQNLGDISGICVATTGNVVGAPYNIWKIANTRYEIPFNTSYTLKAGFKYAVSTVHNNPTTVSLLGFGMGGSLYSIGVYPYDVQTSDSYVGGIPTVGSIVTGVGGGSGFVVNIHLIP